MREESLREERVQLGNHDKSIPEMARTYPRAAATVMAKRIDLTQLVHL